MNLGFLENFFNTGVLVLLLSSSIFYWFQAIVGSHQKWFLGRSMMVLANFFAVSTLVSRWLNGQHVPLSNQLIIKWPSGFFAIDIVIEITGKRRGPLLV